MSSKIRRTGAVILLLGGAAFTPPAGADPVLPPEEGWTLPAVIPMSEGATAYVHGRAFRGTVTFYRDRNDTIRVTDGARDVAVWPRPLPPPSPPNVEEIRRRFGAVPFVRERTGGGSGEEWAAAREAFLDLRRRFSVDLSAAYWDHMDAHLGDRAGARSRGEQAMAPYRPHLDDGRGAFRWEGEDLMVYWRGLPEGELVLIHGGRFRGDDPRRRSRFADGETAARRIGIFARHASGTGAGECVVIVIGPRGMRASTGCGPGSAHAQIESALGGGDTEGPLTAHELREIVASAPEGGR
ncbi:MAG: hypothetical protein ABIK65_11550 [Candidatus Eisenbacteria bacterium]